MIVWEMGIHNLFRYFKFYMCLYFVQLLSEKRFIIVIFNLALY